MSSQADHVDRGLWPGIPLPLQNLTLAYLTLNESAALQLVSKGGRNAAARLFAQLRELTVHRLTSPAVVTLALRHCVVLERIRGSCKPFYDEKRRVRLLNSLPELREWAEDHRARVAAAAASTAASSTESKGSTPSASVSAAAVPASAADSVSAATRVETDNAAAAAAEEQNPLPVEPVASALAYLIRRNRATLRSGPPTEVWVCIP